MDKSLKQVLEKMEREFSMLYEISNAMRTTLKLDQILYIILTALTAHEGLGFNRAMLFLVNEKENMLEGVMGMGPHSAEEAGKIWHAISQRKMTLEDFISAYDSFRKDSESKLNNLVKGIKVPLREDMGILALTILEGMPFEIASEDAKSKVEPELSKTLGTDFFVTMPLKAKDKVLGAILVDNIFNKKAITKGDLRILTMFANHAGLAIENSRLYEETVYLSNIDWLTKLWNYGKFQQLLSLELEKAKIGERQLSMAMLDIDNFKQFNDTFGHVEGDRVLREISKIMKDSSRKLDHVARYGGEEFSIVMPDTNKESAVFLCERLRRDIEKFYLQSQNISAHRNLTISLGIANFPLDADTKEDLINKADLALYESKRAGKNRTCTYRRDMGEKKV